MPKLHYISHSFLRKKGLTRLPWDPTAKHHEQSENNNEASTELLTVNDDIEVGGNNDGHSTTSLGMSTNNSHSDSDDNNNRDSLIQPPPTSDAAASYHSISAQIYSKKRTWDDKAKNNTPLDKLKKKVARRNKPNSIAARALAALELSSSDEEKGEEGKQQMEVANDNNMQNHDKDDCGLKMNGIEAVNLQLIIEEGGALPNGSGKSDAQLVDNNTKKVSLSGLVSLSSTTRRYTSFEQRIDDLRAYKEKHGHMNVSQKEDQSLYDFCKTMRHTRNNPAGKSNNMLINDDRIACLDDMGFDWRRKRMDDSNNPRWVSGSDNIQLVDKCKPSAEEAKGDESYSLINGSNLHQAGSSVNQGVNNTSNTNECPAITGVQKSFAERIADLAAYKAKHGHVTVSKKEDQSLHNFCKTIRYAHSNPEKSNTTLTDDHVASLDALGFDWVLRNSAITFEQRLEDLKAYKEKYGCLNVKKEHNPSLHVFCGNIRHARKNPGKGIKINEDRIASLDALGFDWKVLKGKNASFEQRIDDLRAYKEKHGHVNVSQKEDSSLYNFCHHMRNARKYPEKSHRVLTEDRIASLDALGFDWSIKEQAAKKSFEQRIEDLQAYKKKHGHTNVKEKEDKSLYLFCCNIRQARNNPEKSRVVLTEDCIARLDDMGFDWRRKRMDDSESHGG